MSVTSAATGFCESVIIKNAQKLRETKAFALLTTHSDEWVKQGVVELLDKHPVDFINRARIFLSEGLDRIGLYELKARTEEYINNLKKAFGLVTENLENKTPPVAPPKTEVPPQNGNNSGAAEKTVGQWIQDFFSHPIDTSKLIYAKLELWFKGSEGNIEKKIIEGGTPPKEQPPAAPPKQEPPAAPPQEPPVSQQPPAAPPQQEPPAVPPQQQPPVSQEPPAAPPQKSSSPTSDFDLVPALADKNQIHVAGESVGDFNHNSTTLEAVGEETALNKTGIGKAGANVNIKLATTGEKGNVVNATIIGQVEKKADIESIITSTGKSSNIIYADKYGTDGVKSTQVTKRS